MNQTSNIAEFPKFAIGIPTLNRWDLLRPTLNMYLSSFPDIRIYVLDNGNQQKDVIHSNISYIDNDHNIGVAASWNVLCRKIYSDGNAFALILNDDIWLNQDQYQIGNRLHYQTGSLFMSLSDWCAFAIPQKTFDTIGPFDEVFMAYHEDKDYMRRLKLAQKSCVRVSWLSPVIHRDNSTGQKDPSIYKFAKNGKRYYILKWGGLPGFEKYAIPFNGK